VGDPEVYYNGSLRPDDRRVAVSLLNGSPGNRTIMPEQRASSSFITVVVNWLAARQKQP
jgi:hypothetical protein